MDEKEVVQKTLEELQNKEYVTSKLVLGKDDLLTLQMMNARVMQEAGKFKFTDISRDNLGYLAFQTTQTALAFLNGHQFFNNEDLYMYQFKYIAVHVDNVTQEVDLKPYFVRRERVC